MPAVPVITRSLKVAVPLASVVTVVVPLSVPGPEARDALTLTPASATALPLASWS